jgi:glycosyltransferase involved in cell wall biosynthesis
LELKVVCAQIGARDHYGFPLALHQAGALGALVTDFWSRCPYPPGWPVLGPLAARRHEGLAGARVMPMNGRTLGLELLFRCSGTPGWERILRRNAFFQRAAKARIPWDDPGLRSASGDAPALFSYSYASLALIQEARRRGWKTLLGQIDPGPFEARVVEREEELWPEFRSSWKKAPDGYYERWREELECAGRIVVNSRWSFDALVAEGVAPGKIDEIPLCLAGPRTPDVPAKSYPAAFSRARPLRVLFLGQINLRKGVPALLAAMKQLGNQPVELWMAGTLRFEVPARFRSCGNIKWLGRVNRGLVSDLYRKADLFVFPTHSDGFGMTQLEAQAWRMPVIASRNCGSVVRHGCNGLVLDEVTPEAIARALHDCVTNPGALREWSERSLVEERFGLKAAANGLLDAIRRSDEPGSREKCP